MVRRRPRSLKRVVNLEKVCECRLHLQKKRIKLVDWEKWLNETQLEVGLVSNSSFLNGDIKIMWLVILNFDKQIIVSKLFYFLIYLLVLLCFCIISYYVLHCLLDIVYIYLCVSLEVHCIYSVN
jgi:hypothetical protein